MSISRFETVCWFTNPKVLREIAARMEAKWPKNMVGDSVVVWKSWDRNIKLEIAMNQEDMQRMYPV